MEEFLSDLFACFFLGPSYVWAHYFLTLKNPNNLFNFLIESHPSDDSRMNFLLKTLSILGFHKEADYIANKWKKFISPLNINPEIEYKFAYPIDLIDQIVKIFVEGLNHCHFSNLTPTILQNAEENSIVKLLNDAWSIFLKEKDRYTDWEQLHISILKSLI